LGILAQKAEEIKMQLQKLKVLRYIIIIEKQRVCHNVHDQSERLLKNEHCHLNEMIVLG
jgi:hypothetical protein